MSKSELISDPGNLLGRQGRGSSVPQTPWIPAWDRRSMAGQSELGPPVPIKELVQAAKTQVSELTLRAGESPAYQRTAAWLGEPSRGKELVTDLLPIGGALYLAAGFAAAALESSRKGHKRLTKAFRVVTGICLAAGFAGAGLVGCKEINSAGFSPTSTPTAEPTDLPTETPTRTPTIPPTETKEPTKTPSPTPAVVEGVAFGESMAIGGADLPKETRLATEFADLIGAKKKGWQILASGGNVDCFSGWVGEGDKREFMVFPAHAPEGYEWNGQAMVWLNGRKVLIPDVNPPGGWSGEEGVAGPYEIPDFTFMYVDENGVIRSGSLYPLDVYEALVVPKGQKLEMLGYSGYLLLSGGVVSQVELQEGETLMRASNNIKVFVIVDKDGKIVKTMNLSWLQVFSPEDVLIMRVWQEPEAATPTPRPSTPRPATVTPAEVTPAPPTPASETPVGEPPTETPQPPATATPGTTPTPEATSIPEATQTQVPETPPGGEGSYGWEGVCVHDPEMGWVFTGDMYTSAMTVNEFSELGRYFLPRFPKGANYQKLFFRKTTKSEIGPSFPAGIVLACIFDADGPVRAERIISASYWAMVPDNGCINIIYHPLNPNEILGVRVAYSRGPEACHAPVP